MKNLNEVSAALDSNIPRSAISTRQGPGGKSLSYLATHHVIDRMNKVLGQFSWSSETVEIRCVHSGEVEGYGGKKKHTAHYLARVKIEVQARDENNVVHRTSHMGVGYGDGDDGQNPGKAHELAMKEAESDALKRACKNLGQSMGLALYDKEQTNVDEDAAPAKAPEQPAAKPAPFPKAKAMGKGATRSKMC